MLWTFCSEGNYELSEYMLSLPGIQDPAMDDGTTAFSMALARCDLKLIGLFLSLKIPSDIDHHRLAKEALLELGRYPSEFGSKLRDLLTNVLPEANFEEDNLPIYDLCKE